MDCPSCRSAMLERSLPKHLGGEVVIDLCHGCDGIWFDDRENLALSPAGTIQLFQTIAEERRAERNLLAEALSCARCEGPMQLQFDMVKATRFTYFRCADGHGRFITFFQFLREKNFIQQLTAKELGELRARVRVINCSNCGAPVDLQSALQCDHCQAPISVLDPDRVRKTLEELQQKSAAKESKPPELVALDMQLAKMRIESMYEQLDREDAARSGGFGFGGERRRRQNQRANDLVRMGFNVLGALIRGVLS